MKPEVNLEELDEELDSSCGCNPDHPEICTDLKVKLENGILSCEASEDCKKGIQSIGDMWNKDDLMPRGRNCLVAFQAIKKLNDLCINQ